MYLMFGLACSTSSTSFSCTSLPVSPYLVATILRSRRASRQANKEAYQQQAVLSLELESQKFIDLEKSPKKQPKHTTNQSLTSKLAAAPVFRSESADAIGRSSRHTFVHQMSI